jgi:hypothetical protein
MAFIRSFRDQLVSGIAIQIRGGLRISKIISLSNVLHIRSVNNISRMDNRLLALKIPMLPPWRIVLPTRLLDAMSVVKRDICLTIVLRSRTSRLLKARKAIRGNSVTEPSKL